MRVILFQPWGAELVRAGTKRQTIRKTARCKPGDMLSLRRWTGAPYRSKQEVIREEMCTDVTPIRIDPDRVTLYDDPLSDDPRTLGIGEARDIAIADGFTGLNEMLAWFENTHGLPFYGYVIKW
jgi:hypothetical protein